LHNQQSCFCVRHCAIAPIRLKSSPISYGISNRGVTLSRYTQPEKDQKMLLFQLGWELPAQPPPQITTQGQLKTD